MSVGQRVKERMATLGITQAELARRVGITQPAINNIIRRNKSGTMFLHQIARELGTTPAYLSGETDDPTEGALPSPTPQLVAEQIDALLIPQVDVTYSMGNGSAVDEWPVIQMVPFSRELIRSLTSASPEHLMLAKGDGDSMFPTIRDQEFMLIDRSDKTPIQQDLIWAVAYGGWGMIKRLRSLADGSLQINSDNPAVAPIIAVDGEAHVVGRVVAIIRRL